MKKAIFGAAMALMLSLPAQAQVNISKIAGLTPAGVKPFLGEPTKSEIVKPSGTPCPCTKNYYRDGAIEVVFIKGLGR